MVSWTQPGQGFGLEEATHGITNWTVNRKPDNPNDRVGSAVDRKIQYSHIYIDVKNYSKGNVNDLAKLFISFIEIFLFETLDITSILSNEIFLFPLRGIDFFLSTNNLASLP